MPSLVSSAIPATQHFLSMPFRRNKKSYELNPPDVVHNVVYLGNVLTVMAKGQDSVGKPLSVIWRTYNSKKSRRDIAMKLTVTRQGLKATSKQGLTEYWAHRITYCVAPPEYPRIFCWVYKHEGKRMRPEVRCHAVLCKKAEEPIEICTSLTDSLHAALLEYRREKLAVERARKNSLCSGLGGVPPRRKLMLQTGSLNFRPPVCRSKSAPRLGCIDEEDEHNEIELIDEDDDEYDADGFSDIDSLSYRTTPMINGCGSSECEGSSCGGNESSTDSASGSGSADYHPDDSSSITSCSNKSPSPTLAVGRISSAPLITRGGDALATLSRSLDESHSNSVESGQKNGVNCKAAYSLPDRKSLLQAENSSARSLYLKKRWHQQQTVGRQRATCLKSQEPYVEVAASALEELTVDERSGECNNNNNNCQTEYSGVEFMLSSSYCSASTSASSSFDDGVILGGARNPQGVAPLRTHKPTDCGSITADALERCFSKASRSNRPKFCAQDSYGDSLSDESGYAEEINLKRPTKEKLMEKVTEVDTDTSMTKVVTARLVIIQSNETSGV